MRSRRSVFSAVAAVSVLMQSACGTGAGGDLTGGDPGSGTRVQGQVPQRMTGTWSGTNESVNLAWRLSQHGDEVTGTSRVIGKGGWTGRDGRVEGTLSGSTFTFSETHPAGSLTEADCSAELAGTLEVRTIMVPAPGNTPPAYPPNTWYYPQNPYNSPVARTVMSGVVSGTACGTPFSGMLSIYKD